MPKGKGDADRLAEEHGLRNAGEVVPDSNVFYFKLPKDSDRVVQVAFQKGSSEDFSVPSSSVVKVPFIRN